MNVPDESFLSYLRGEVENAGESYEKAVEEVFALLAGPQVQPGPELNHAIQLLSENLRLYAGSIRRMASFVSHQAVPRARHFAAHA